MKISIYNQKKNYSGIYKIDFPNGKSYIGQSNNIIRRIREHNCEEKQLVINNAIKKYGKVKEFILLEEISPDNKELMNEREKYYIQLYDTTNKDKGYNISIGGEGFNRVITEKIRNLQRDIINSNYTLKELSLMYNMDITSLSEINQGKRYFNKELDYPLRKKKIYHSYILTEEEINEIKNILKNDIKVTMEELAMFYCVHVNTIENINLGHSPYYDEKLAYPLRKKNQNFCKFNSEEVKEIIKLLRDTNLPQTEIAKQFNCDRKLIGQINSGKKYYIEGESYPIRITAKRLSLQDK